MNLIYDEGANLNVLDGKTVAVVGYGSQGRAQALCMRDSGLKVIVGSRSGKSFDLAQADGFEVMSTEDAAAKADIIHLLLPDEHHASVYKNEIEKSMTSGKVLSCSHGFNIVFKEISPQEDIDVILVAPKSPATEERKAYLEGFGAPGLIAVHQDASGQAKDIALAMAKAMGFTRAGVLECTFEQETNEDLFGEQNVLCGGLVDLMKYGFEVLTEAGYPPEMAYFECVHEVKLIVDLIYEGGIEKMNSVISNTAEWGEYSNGPKIITPDVKERMRASLKNIESGNFAKEWMAEARKGYPTLLKKRAAIGEHPVEEVGAKIRAMFQKGK